jgi:hypothetical protein
MINTSFELTRNAFGRLCLTHHNTETYEGVYLVRAFPFQAPDEYISILTPTGQEVAWIKRLSDLKPDMQILINEELASRQFMPEILRIHRVSSFITPTNWTVTTDKGDTDFLLMDDEDIQRFGTDKLILVDSYGTHFIIRNINALDKHSQKILEQFW